MDNRYVAYHRHKWWDEFDEKTMTVVVTYWVGDAEVEGVVLPVKFEVCPTCKGRGTHVNPSIDSHGLSREDFDEDPDFRRDYFSGAYNVDCYECGGRRVVPVLLEEQCSPEVVREVKNHIESLEREAYEESRNAEMGY